jgi:hypothetical protein
MMTRRKRWYFAIMGTCLTLFVLSWSVIRLVSVPAAVALSVVAMCLPPLAAIVGNARGRDERWWDEPPLPRPRIPRQRRPEDRRRTPPD